MVLRPILGSVGKERVMVFFVARGPVADGREIQRWSAAEGKGIRFAEIRGRLLGKTETRGRNR